MSFIHLHVYSAYSLLSSTVHIEDLVKAACENHFMAVALTDRNVMYGSVAFYNECLKNGIKPILGLTVDVISERNVDKAYPLVLLAENNIGYHNLLKITSVVQTKSAAGIPVKWLKPYSEGLIAISGGLEGEIENCILSGDEEGARESIKLFKNIFTGNRFYFSIQNHLIEREITLNNQLAKLGKEYGINLAAANTVYYIKREDAFAQECLLAIKNGDKLQDEDREKLESDQYYLKNREEMAEYLSDYPDALENSLLIAERCNVKLALNERHLPKYPLGNGETADTFLEKVCSEGLIERFPAPQGEYWERLRYELSIIKKMQFSDYFLIVWDFMKYAREHQILTGPGRGSAAGSLVAYVLQITDVDPIKHQLLFERFLNPERISMPDIDIDFPDIRRDEVIEYVVNKYGELHVAQIVTFGTLAAKAAMRDVGRAFGLNSKELDQVSRMVPSKLGISLKDALKESEPLRNFIGQSELNKKLYETAVKLEGLPRHTSTHAAGVVISEVPLVHMVPIQKGSNNVYLTQYSMEHLDRIGLLKMDFLGLRNLTLIENIVSSIRRSTGERLDIRTIPLDDRDTYELLARGETTGVFQLESEGMRKVLMRLIPSRFEDIVAVNALYRPGPMENIPMFIDRKHGREPVYYPHQDLEPILANTYGVIVYQEQIMQIASKMAGFSLGEADLLRRAVSKKQKEVLDREREHFVRGALSKGYEKPLANEIYDLIVKFANYGFNRSHAVAYSFIAYQLAYLKAHYPVHFMAGLLTSVIGNEAKIAQYVREAKQKNIQVLPPSINHSMFIFQPGKDTIRYSLAAIKGIGASALKEIFRERKRKLFDDLFDFCLRVSTKAVNRKALEVLVHSGSFDEFGQDRAVLLASIDVAMEHADLVKPDEDGQFDLFAEEAMMLKPKYVEVDPIRQEDKLSFEKEVLGFYLSDHPLSLYETSLQERGAINLADLEAGTYKKAAVGVYVTEAKKIRTKKGESMAFFTLSDSSGEIEAVAFPDAYRKLSYLLVQGQLAVVEGKTEEREEKKQLIIQDADEISGWIKKHASRKAVLYLKVEKDMEEPGILRSLNNFLKKNRGDTKVILHYEGSKTTVQLPMDSYISPNPEILQTLKDMLGDGNVILKD